MMKVSEYRQRAADCRREAARAVLPDIRDDFLKIAEKWEALADEQKRALPVPIAAGPY
jgi:hypothetical protein